MQVNFYTFYKRINSTKQPEGDGIAIQCELKQDCTVLNPVLIIKSDGTIANYNYAYIPKWKKYYFISDTTISTGGRFVVSLSCDELASWKDSIGRYTCFVERAASSYNSLVADPLLSNQENIINDVKEVTVIGDTFDAVTGCYILRAVNNKGSASGICTYVVSEGDLAAVMGYMFNADNFADVLSDEVTKTFFNPFQYITSVLWLPINIGNLQSVQEENITFGWWESSISAHYLSGSGVEVFTSDINIPANSYSDWRAYDNRFSCYTLYLPAVGSVPVNAAEVKNKLSVEMSIDALTGIAEYRLLGGETVNDPIIATYKCRMGVDVQIGQMNSVLGTVAGGAASTIGSIASGNYLGAAMQAVDTVQSAFSPTPSVNGSVGGRQTLRTNHNIVLSLLNIGACEYPTTVAGRPLFANKKLSDLSGYIKCGNASIDIGGYDTEKETVNGYLNGGFYYE